MLYAVLPLCNCTLTVQHYRSWLCCSEGCIIAIDCAVGDEVLGAKGGNGGGRGWGEWMGQVEGKGGHLALQWWCQISTPSLSHLLCS